MTSRSFYFCRIKKYFYTNSGIPFVATSSIRVYPEKCSDILKKWWEFWNPENEGI